jgi:hypothetical protein|tara:strand:- start:784 stop:1578 length:795 start_codon:yes stop_codon:yes gene_type:complete
MRLLVFIILFCGFYIFAANAKDYGGYGEYRFGPNVSESRACELAFEKAKINALSKVFGEKIHASDFLRCSESDNVECELNQYTLITSDGTINKIKKKTSGVTKQEGFSICQCQIIASIDKPKHQPDPNFHFNARSNKRFFRDLEEYMIQIEPSTKMFVNIFSWNPYASKENQVSRIFPNKYEKDNKIENKRIIPGKEKGYKLKAKYPDEVQGKKHIDQYLIVLATKKKITFLKDYEFKNFQAIIYEIPNNKKRKETIIYDVLKN